MQKRASAKKRGQKGPLYRLLDAAKFLNFRSLSLTPYLYFRNDEEVVSIEIMISKFVVSLMKECLNLANSLELDYLVHNASVYLWNYAQKLLISSNFEFIPMMFRDAFEILTDGKTELAPDLVIHMATALANSPLVEKEETMTSETSISGAYNNPFLWKFLPKSCTIENIRAFVR